MDETMGVKKVALLELAFHNEVLSAYSYAFLHQGCLVICFTNDFCFSHFDSHLAGEVEWELKEKNESHLEYLLRIEKIISEYDHIIILTPDPIKKELLSFDFLKKSTLVVHDVHAWFKPFSSIRLHKYSLKENIIDILRIVKFVISGENKVTKKVIKRCKNLAFPSLAVHQYFEENFTCNKKTFVLDFAIALNTNLKRKKNGVEYIITIPGNVNDKSRDYGEVIKVIKSLGENKELPKIRLQLLGRADSEYGKMVIKRLNEVKGNIALEFSDSFISQKQFDDKIKSSDLLWLPVSKTMKYRFFAEKNGYSCVSGNINDVLRYGITGLIPEFYPVEEGFKSEFLIYKDITECGEIIRELFDGKLIDQEISSELIKRINSRYKKYTEYN